MSPRLFVRTLVGSGLLLATVACSSLPGSLQPTSWGADSEGVPRASVHLDDFGVGGGLDNLGSGSSTQSMFARTAMLAGQDGAEQTVSPLAGRKLIYNGSLHLSVLDRAEAGQVARDLAIRMGGYLQSMRDSSAVLRIPVDRFEEAMEAAEALGQVVGREVAVQDVTEEFLDVELQLKNKRALSDRLVELLARAETVEAALKVETELARVRSEVERLEGRLKFLRNNIAFATLKLQFTQASANTARKSRLPFPWLSRLGVQRLLELSR